MRLDVGTLNVGAVTQGLREAAMRGLVLGGELTLTVSNQRVPHEDGDLERTGAVSADEGAGKVAVSYRDVAYKGQAVDHHEDLTMKHDAGRSAKYLETALNETAPKIGPLVQGEMRKVTGG